MKSKSTVAIALLWFCPAVWAQLSKADDAAAAMLTKAQDATTLDSSITIPFRLHAHATFFDGHSKPASAEITYLFAARDRWRMEISGSDGTDTRVAAQGQLWRTGPDLERAKERHLEIATHFSERLLTLSNGTASSPHAKEVNGVPCKCIKLTRGNFSREVCLDSKNGLPVQVKDAGLEFEIEGGNYRSLGLKRFPDRIRYFERGKQMLLMDVDSLEELGEAGGEAFAPIPGVRPIPWCADEKTPRPEHFNASSFPFLLFVPASSVMWSAALPFASMPSSKFLLLVFKVGSDGRVKDLKVYDKHGALVENDTDTEKLRNSTFYPAICGDRVVEGEFVLWLPRP